MPETVLVYGGTGVQGGAIAHTFASAGFNTRTVSRNPKSDVAQDLVKNGIEVYEGDLGDIQSLQAPNQGVDIVALVIPFFVMPPANPIDYMQNAVNAAKSADVNLIVWNTSGPIPDERLGHPMIDYRHDLHQILQDSGIQYIGLAPGSYMENLMGPWTVTDIKSKDELAYAIPDGEGLSWIAISDVAKLMVEAAKHPELANQLFRINGPEKLSGEAMAEQFTQALDREISWRRLTPREFGDKVGVVMGQDAGNALAEDYAIINKNFSTVMPYNDMQPVLDKLPVELTTLKDWVQQHQFMFQPEVEPSTN